MNYPVKMKRRGYDLVVEFKSEFVATMISGSCYDVNVGETSFEWASCLDKESWQPYETPKETPKIERLQAISKELEVLTKSDCNYLMHSTGEGYFGNDKESVLFRFYSHQEIESEFTTYKETLKPKRVLMEARALYKKTLFMDDSVMEITSINEMFVSFLESHELVSSTVEELQKEGYVWGNDIDSQRYNFYGEEV